MSVYAVYQEIIDIFMGLAKSARLEKHNEKAVLLWLYAKAKFEKRKKNLTIEEAMTII